MPEADGDVVTVMEASIDLVCMRIAAEKEIVEDKEVSRAHNLLKQHDYGSLSRCRHENGSTSVV